MEKIQEPEDSPQLDFFHSLRGDEQGEEGPTMKISANISEWISKLDATLPTEYQAFRDLLKTTGDNWSSYRLSKCLTDRKYIGIVEDRAKLRGKDGDKWFHHWISGTRPAADDLYELACSLAPPHAGDGIETRVREFLIHSIGEQLLLFGIDEFEELIEEKRATEKTLKDSLWAPGHNRYSEDKSILRLRDDLVELHRVDTTLNLNKLESEWIDLKAKLVDTQLIVLNRAATQSHTDVEGCMQQIQLYTKLQDEMTKTLTTFKEFTTESAWRAFKESCENVHIDPGTCAVQIDPEAFHMSLVQTSTFGEFKETARLCADALGEDE